MKRIIMVAGLPSGGTSVVAGILHHLGVDMGRVRSDEETLAAARTLKSARHYRGYECTVLAKMFSTSSPYRVVREYVQRRCERPAGFKSNLCVLLGNSLDPIETLPISVLHVTRDLQDTFESDIKYTGNDTDRAQLRGLLHLGLTRLVERIPPTLTLSYEEILRDRYGTVTSIIRAFGLSASADTVDQAAQFIDPENGGAIAELLEIA